MTTVTGTNTTFYVGNKCRRRHLVSATNVGECEQADTARYPTNRLTDAAVQRLVESQYLAQITTTKGVQKVL